MSSDVDLSHLFPLERLIRRHPRATDAALLVLFTTPLWARFALIAWNYWSTN